MQSIKIGCLAVLLLILGGAVAGCASDGGASAVAQSNASSTTTMPAHAECLVCKKNVDLACVDVPVDQTTPTYAYQGKTYYFCSDECRNEFAKHPAKYLSAGH